MTCSMTHLSQDLSHDLSHPLGAINQMCHHQFQQPSATQVTHLILNWFIKNHDSYDMSHIILVKSDDKSSTDMKCMNFDVKWILLTTNFSPIIVVINLNQLFELILEIWMSSRIERSVFTFSFQRHHHDKSWRFWWFLWFFDSLADRMFVLNLTRAAWVWPTAQKSCSMIANHFAPQTQNHFWLIFDELVYTK